MISHVPCGAGIYPSSFEMEGTHSAQTGSRYVQQTTLLDERANCGHNIAPGFAMTVDVGFAKLTNRSEAIRFAARFNAAMRRQSVLVD
jgi:hypothetical protein